MSDDRLFFEPPAASDPAYARLASEYRRLVRKRQLRRLASAFCAVLIAALILLVAATAHGQTLYVCTASWCEPCQDMKPVVARIKADGYAVHDVDCSRGVPRDWQALGVRKVPTFVAARDGVATGMIVGKCSREDLLRLLEMLPASRLQQHRTRYVSNAEGPVTIGVDGQRTRTVIKSGKAIHGVPAEVDANVLDSIVRVRVNDGQEHQMTQHGRRLVDVFSVGSGTYIHTDGQYGYVLTNEHVVRDAARVQGAIDVGFPNGWHSTGTVITRDKTWDLALLQINRPPHNPPPVPLAPSVALGDTLTTAGYGSGDLRTDRGVFDQALAPNQSSPYELLNVNGAHARQGDSGGPILNAQGELAGVLWGSDHGDGQGRYVVGPRAERIHVQLCQQMQVREWIDACGRRRRGYVRVEQPPQPTNPNPPSKPPTKPPTKPSNPPCTCQADGQTCQCEQQGKQCSCAADGKLCSCLADGKQCECDPGEIDRLERLILERETKLRTEIAEAVAKAKCKCEEKQPDDPAPPAPTTGEIIGWDAIEIDRN